MIWKNNEALTFYIHTLQLLRKQIMSFALYDFIWLAKQQTLLHSPLWGPGAAQYTVTLHRYLFFFSFFNLL